MYAPVTKNLKFLVNFFGTKQGLRTPISGYLACSNSVLGNVFFGVAPLDVRRDLLSPSEENVLLVFFFKKINQFKL